MTVAVFGTRCDKLSLWNRDFYCIRHIIIVYRLLERLGCEPEGRNKLLGLKREIFRLFSQLLLAQLGNKLIFKSQSKKKLFLLFLIRKTNYSFRFAIYLIAHYLFRR